MPVKKVVKPKKEPIKNKTNRKTTKPHKLPEEYLEGRIDISKALKLRLKNHLSYPEIGKQLGVSAQAVHERLQSFMKYISDPEANKAYEENKSEILTVAERVLVENILDPDKLEKANLNNVAYALTQVNVANRLEKGQATAINDDVDSILQRIDNRFQKAIDVTPKV